MVAFAAPKQATALEDWEDGARFDEGFGVGRARIIVADGATEAFDTNRWVGLLVETFVPDNNDGDAGGGPDLNRQSMQEWLSSLQRRWIDDAPTNFGSYLAEQKFKTSGSFATMVGCELDGLEGRRPTWQAVSVGDTVLFHVRGNATRSVFPPMLAGDFGNRPATVHTDPRRLTQMTADLQFSDGDLALGDWLFIATDALANWIIQTADQDEQTLWSVLSALDDTQFQRLVDDYRAAGTLKDDDVTLLRVHLVEEPSPLMVPK